MTIKELETRTGMVRANIRFYEGEGLIAPKRLPNGYRDYSEEDARTLEKIKLLRQLQLDIGTIRRVQDGSLTLEQALFAQLTKLEGDKAVIERAAEVCRELEKSGVEYAALEPQPWLNQLQSGTKTQFWEPLPASLEEGNAEENVHWACWHPWRRWLARRLDMGLYRTVFYLLWIALLRDWTIVQATGLISLVQGFVLLAFTLAVEPLWLHYWGWTPGKWVFGLKVRNVNGDRLTLNRAFQRSYEVFRDGYGWGIPIWALWKMRQCQKLSLQGRDCYWDEDEDYRYTKEERRFSGQVYVAVWALCVAVLLPGFLYTRFPVNRGALTVEEFAQNYNHYFEQLVTDQRSTGMPTLSKNGLWVEGKNQSELIIVDIMNEGSTLWDDPVFTLDEGRVTAVTLHAESTNEIVFDLGTRELLTLLAMSGSVDGLNIFNYDLDGWANACREPMSLWEELDFTYRGLRITMQAEAEGYEPWGYGNLWAADGESRHCEKTLTISLCEP